MRDIKRKLEQLMNPTSDYLFNSVGNIAERSLPRCNVQHIGNAPILTVFLPAHIFNTDNKP